MMPDGLPGTYNEELGRQLLELLRQAACMPAGQRPWIGMQWEIFDAIESRWQSSFGDLLELVPLSHVAAPPLFHVDEIVNVRVIRRHLDDALIDLQAIQARRLPRTPSTQAGRILAARMAEILPVRTNLTNADRHGFVQHQASVEPAWADAKAIAGSFNRLLTDAHFHRDFHDAAGSPVVELHHLYREKVGSVGVEQRVLPPADSTLRRFQRLRVNRLIIEAIFPQEQVVKRGRYLSTRGVLTQLFNASRNESAAPFEQVRIYGHPAHSPRCRRQFLESDWVRLDRIPADCIHDVCAGQHIDWDAATAQMCCRSQQNWDDYERMHQANWD